MITEIRFCNLKFKGLLRQEIFDMSKERMVQIITVGAEFIIEAQKNERLRRIINENVATFDGHLPYLIACRQNPKISFEKIAGADFIYDVCAYAREYNKRIFLLGGYYDSNADSVKKMKKMGIVSEGFVTGFIPYPFPKERNEEILTYISNFKPHYIFVGLGILKQEYWIEENREELERIGVEIAVGCGGSMEVFSNKIQRAPVWVQKLCLEGFYRFLKEPSFVRLKRFMNTFKFLKYV